MTATDVAPSAGGLNPTFVRLEISRLVHNRQFLIFTLLLPAVLYLALFKQGNSAGDASLAHGNFAAWMMLGVAVYGAAAASTSTAAAISIERSSGWMRSLRLTPVSPVAYVVMKALVSMVVAGLPVAVVAGLGAATGVQAEPAVWIIGLLVAWIGSLVFAVLGLAIGLSFRPEIVMHMPGLTMTALAFIGNLFIPLSGTMLTISSFTPMYGVAVLARYPLNDGYTFSGEHISLLGAVINAVVWVSVFAGIAAVRFGRSSERQ